MISSLCVFVCQASVTEASEDMGIVFCFVFICVVCFSGFVYAIASAAREFLYRKNNEYYEIKKKRKKKKRLNRSFSPALHTVCSPPPQGHIYRE